MIFYVIPMISIILGLDIRPHLRFDHFIYNSMEGEVMFHLGDFVDGLELLNLFRSTFGKQCQMLLSIKDSF